MMENKEPTSLAPSMVTERVIVGIPGLAVQSGAAESIGMQRTGSFVRCCLFFCFFSFRQKKERSLFRYQRYV